MLLDHAIALHCTRTSDVCNREIQFNVTQHLGLIQLDFHFGNPERSVADAHEVASRIGGQSVSLEVAEGIGMDALHLFHL